MAATNFVIVVKVMAVQHRSPLALSVIIPYNFHVAVVSPVLFQTLFKMS